MDVFAARPQPEEWAKVIEEVTEIAVDLLNEPRIQKAIADPTLLHKLDPKFFPTSDWRWDTIPVFITRTAIMMWKQKQIDTTYRSVLNFYETLIKRDIMNTLPPEGSTQQRQLDLWMPKFTAGEIERPLKIARQYLIEKVGMEPDLLPTIPKWAMVPAQIIKPLVPTVTNRITALLKPMLLKDNPMMSTNQYVQHVAPDNEGAPSPMHQSVAPIIPEIEHPEGDPNPMHQKIIAWVHSSCRFASADRKAVN